MVEVFEKGMINEAQVFGRTDMEPGHVLSGPAVITQEDCTTCVPSGFSITVDDYGNLIIQEKI
jgi:N-methylhydantoinase A